VSSDKRAAVDSIRCELEKSRGTHIWMDYINALRLISQVVFTRSSGFILELVQNAEDSGQGLPNDGEISITLNRQRLKFVHNGRPFDEENLKAICGIRSSKKPERGTLGYLGIGFKSVFKVADCSEVYSNGFRFKFDRNHQEWSDHSAEIPWQVIPVWVEQPSEPVDPEKTTFCIHLRNEEAYEHLIQGLKAIHAQLYLFLKWIKRISIAHEGSGQSWTVENLGCTSEGITVLKQNDSKHRFRFFRGEVAVPDAVKADRLTQEYRANVSRREIAIAFPITEEGDLDPSPSSAMYGGVYSFLPLGESKSGAKFPIQADFLVQPGRDSINPEAAWNHWLLDEVTALCKEAIEYFQKHDVWKFQYLAAFHFTHSPGYEAYDKLFGPKLIDPIEKWISESQSVPTATGTWARPSNVVFVEESRDAIEALSQLGILAPGEIAPAFGRSPELTRVHPKAAEWRADLFKKVNRWSLFQNEEFFAAKAQSYDGPAWFRQLYLWLHKYPFYETYRRSRRVKGYHQEKIVLRADGTVTAGGSVFLLDLGAADPHLLELASGLKETKPMLHPDVLARAGESDREVLKSFLTGLAGVQKMDEKAVCSEVILPRIAIAAPPPPREELLALTKYCQQHLHPAALQGNEIWVVNKGAQVRKASEVLFPVEFKPARNWETHKQYVPGADFLSAEYVNSCTESVQFQTWLTFMEYGGVKQSPDSGVEVFAINFAEVALETRFRKVVRVERLNPGYDFEAENSGGQRMHIEVKGLTAEGDVELTPNEARAAGVHRSTYYLCVVSGVPDNPTAYLLHDPDSVGEREKLTIRAADWRRERLA
jgi:hypothetical protein